MNKLNQVSKEIITVEMPNGYYLFKLGKLLDDKKISINRFMRETNTDFKTIKKHANGLVSQIDIDVIDKWCAYLEVEAIDIYEYKRKLSKSFQK